MPTVPSPQNGGSLPVEVLLDFDGTLVEENVAIVLVERFCPDGDRVAHEVDEQLHRGEITLRQAWARQVALLPAHREQEMVDHVRRAIALRQGAHELLDLLSSAAIPVTIVSGGLDFYIAPILAEHGISLPVLSDTVRPDGGAGWVVDHPHGHPSCRLCGICKAQCVRALAHPSRRTVFIGDGSTDRYAAEVADIVFARRRLKTYCTQSGVPFYPFETFEPVTEQFRRWLSHADPLPAPRGLGLASSKCPISQSLAAVGPRGAPEGPALAWPARPAGVAPGPASVAPGPTPPRGP